MLLIGRVNRYVVRGVGSGDEDTVREAKAGRVSLGGEDDSGVRTDDSEAERCERWRMRSEGRYGHRGIQW
jgi:hypothetical protein